MVKLYLLVFLSAAGSLVCSCSRAINPSHSAALTQAMQPADLKAYILKQSQPGGKLDFFTAVKGHEYEGRQIKPGIYANGLEFALYSWGRSVKELGIKTVEEAYDIYAEVKGRPITPRDKGPMKLGFEDSNR